MGSKTYIEISGTSIKEISAERRIDGVNEYLLGGDYFLISQQALTGVSPDREYQMRDGVTLTNEYMSKNMTYSQLSGQMFKLCKDNFGFKSMAYESEENYSLAGHVHNYSAVSVWPNAEYQPNRDGSNLSVLSAVVEFVIDSKRTTLYAPKVNVYESPKPAIGQLKFLLKTPPSLPNTDAFYGSSSFTGWVYPDGRSVTKTRFPDAFDAFGYSYGGSGENFNIPSLTDFISLNSKNMGFNCAPKVPEVKSLPSHRHDISNPNISGSVKLTYSFCTVDNTDPGYACHGAISTGKVDRGQDYDVKFKMNNPTCNNVTTDLNENYQADQSTETYPSHNMLPVMIYIGGER